ncbi:MAG TPA: sulfite oxidase [Gemmataceae bacterium]|nr:sulfite oxidase [Gemmataceae bacterium]
MEEKRERAIGRREFLGGAAAGAAPFVFGAAARADEPPAPPGAPWIGVISRQRNPDNLEFPFPTLGGFLTPNEQFYVRSHFDVPSLEADSWRLSVEGAVQKPFEIGCDDLRKMPSHTVTALLECAGNGRVFLKPPQLGIRWELGGASNAEWTGVRLSDLLDRAGVRDGAVDVVLEGADKGEYRDPNPKTPGVIPYARSLPLEKARRPEVLLAYRMNGKDLSSAHGFPVRAVVPGWYGMASVKWLKRILVVDRPFSGFFQTFMYTMWERRDGLPTLAPVRDLQVKAEIARPALDEVVPAKSKQRVFGAAWAGEADVTRVDVSTDGGKSWDEARLLDKAVPFAWRLWEHEWQTPEKAGRRVLMARATDSRGRVQPMERDDDRRDGMISHVLPVEVEVR